MCACAHGVLTKKGNLILISAGLINVGSIYKVLLAKLIVH